jgi:hypothetical protein
MLRESRDQYTKPVQRFHAGHKPSHNWPSRCCDVVQSAADGLNVVKFVIGV